MHLSRLRLNPQSRQARRDWGDVYELHRTLVRGVVGLDDPQADVGRILFRAEPVADGPPTLLVQSERQPLWTGPPFDGDYLDEPAAVTTLMESLPAEGNLRFRLRANPTVKKDGKRWGIFAEEARRAWLDRKAAAGGFAVDPATLLVTPEPRVYGRKGGRTLTFDSVRFDGHLTVADPAAFLQTLHAGIGSAKAFGFGLLSVMR